MDATITFNPERPEDVARVRALLDRIEGPVVTAEPAPAVELPESVQTSISRVTPERQNEVTALIKKALAEQPELYADGQTGGAVVHLRLPGVRRAVAAVHPSRVTFNLPADYAGRYAHADATPDSGHQVSLKIKGRGREARSEYRQALADVIEHEQDKRGVLDTPRTEGTDPASDSSTAG